LVEAPRMDRIKTVMKYTANSLAMEDYVIAQYDDSRYLMRVTSLYPKELVGHAMRSDSDPAKGEDRTFKSVWTSSAGNESWKTHRPGADGPYTLPLKYDDILLAFKTLPNLRIPASIYGLWREKYGEVPMCASLVPLVQHAMMLFVDPLPRGKRHVLTLPEKGGTPIFSGEGIL
jgi:hypothetical protein